MIGPTVAIAFESRDVRFLQVRVAGNDIFNEMSVIRSGMHLCCFAFLIKLEHQVCNAK